MATAAGTPDDRPPEGAQGRARPKARPARLWALRLVGLAALAAWAGTAAFHATKDLPPGTRVASPAVAVAADQVELLFDTTTADAYGRPIVEQRIFDETLRIVSAARRLVVIDQFLFNDHSGAATDPGAPAPPPRALSRELAEALIAARRAHPQLRVLVITDPINDVYGAMPAPVLAALRRAGVEVVTTDLEPLRDSNPVYSGLWRLAIAGWSETSTGPGWLPNPLDIGPDRVPFDAWARLMNLKANRRSVLIADDGTGGIVGVVGSARPHDASSAHSNVALRVRGEALRPLFESEIRIARFSGWRGVPILLPAPESPADAAAVRGRAPAAGRAGRPATPDDPSARLGVSVLTEGGLRDALLERLEAAQTGERIEIAMRYLSERAVIQALLNASRRGATVRIMLDPNVEAFGYPQSGIPNRPVASELVSRSDGAIKLRWYRTHGELFNVALVAIGNRERVWLTTGSAQLTRRNLGDFTLEANVAVEAPRTAAVAIELDRWFDRLWNNRAPAGVEFTAEFGAYADPSQSRYWAYRLMESTGIGSF